MSKARGHGWGALVSALLRSYVADLRRWTNRLAASYGAAAGLMVGGVLALFAAVAVGITALFHLIEPHYGPGAAYGGIGGGLLLLAIVLFLGGWTILRRKVPQVPRPYAEARAAKRRLLRPAAPRSVGSRLQAEIAQTDPVTRLLIGASVAMLVGWMAASRQPSGRTRRVRR